MDVKNFVNFIVCLSLVLTLPMYGSGGRIRAGNLSFELGNSELIDSSQMMSARFSSMFIIQESNVFYTGEKRVHCLSQIFWLPIRKMQAPIEEILAMPNGKIVPCALLALHYEEHSFSEII
ncbi:uncharacterized protein LOC122008476 isoform X2 [Zingiber officinale]|uniref:uncharacterized protein LOC122008476 isoform X2 n=1 Tax=Zingiber officinale TaxID=94328 RepID=UPI001C4B8E54|nr:uncharacterized protein LOC122008476 isoform X2 [Zingiber officinale]